MAVTVIRIKRRLDLEPSDTIVLNAKRRKYDTGEACALSVNDEKTVLKHVGTLGIKVKYFSFSLFSYIYLFFIIQINFDKRCGLLF